MADEVYSLKFKVGNAAETELFTNYKGVLLEGTDRPQELEPENVTTQEWYGQGGEEVFIPSGGIVWKAYDWKAKIGLKAENKSVLKGYFDAFVNALKGNKFQITHTYSGVVMKGCYLKGVTQEECELNASGESFMIINVTFRVTEP